MAYQAGEFVRKKAQNKSCAFLKSTIKVYKSTVLTRPTGEARYARFLQEIPVKINADKKTNFTQFTFTLFTTSVVGIDSGFRISTLYTHGPQAIDEESSLRSLFIKKSR